MLGYAVDAAADTVPYVPDVAADELVGTVTFAYVWSDLSI